MTAPTTTSPAGGDPFDPERAPRKEIGRPSNLQVVYSTRGDRSWQPRYADPNPLLRFPESVKVYDVMTRTDDQIDSVLRSVMLPILDAGWDLKTEGVHDDVVRFVRDQLALPEPGKVPQHRRRGTAGINWTEHLREALDCLAYGFAPFEQTYTVTFPGEPGHPQLARWAAQPAVQLRKLAARPPATIRRLRLDQDGGLVSILQNPPEGEPDWFNRPDGEPGLEIPVSQLVMYTNDRKGADWTGVSILRSAYAPWKAKEQFRRLDVMAAERTSMGLPVVKFDPAVMTQAQALELAMSVRAGAEAGIALPLGAEIELMGVSGTVPDLAPRIEAYNQAIGRASLAMFLNLGHDNGARSLGDTFLGFFIRALQSLANQIAVTATEHIIRDLVEWNFGLDEAYPHLTAGAITAEMALAPDGLGQLITAGVVVPDDPLEDWARHRWRMPAADPDTARKKEAPAATPAVGPADPGGGPGEAAPDNPFKPADGAQDDPAAPPADGKPPAGGKDLSDAEVPAGMVRVGGYVRRLPGHASLAGYAAWLASQVQE